jgi:hypothetical protein
MGAAPVAARTLAVRAAPAIALLTAGLLAACPAIARAAARPAPGGLRLGFVSSIRSSWTIAVSDCPSCSQPQRSTGSYRAGGGRAVVRRGSTSLSVAVAGARRRSSLRCLGPDISASPTPPAPRSLALQAGRRGSRALRFAWRLPTCDPEIDQPVADALIPAASVSRAYLRRDTAYLRLRGRRSFDVAPDADFPPPDVGPPPGHWTGTLTWSLTVKLVRCVTRRAHGRRVRRCAF